MRAQQFQHGDVVVRIGRVLAKRVASFVAVSDAGGVVLLAEARGIKRELETIRESLSIGERFDPFKRAKIAGIVGSLRDRIEAAKPVKIAARRGSVTGRPRVRSTVTKPSALREFRMSTPAQTFLFSERVQRRKVVRVDTVAFRDAWLDFVAYIHARGGISDARLGSWVTNVPAFGAIYGNPEKYRQSVR